MDLLSRIVSDYGYLGIFTFLALGIFSISIPDELMLLIAGYFASRGELRLDLTIIIVFLGSISGISLNYIVGRYFGTHLIKKARFFLPNRLDRVNDIQGWFNRFGGWVLFLGYFLPGSRHWFPVVAGISKLPPAVFASYAYPGGFLWSLALIFLGYSWGTEWPVFSKNIIICLALAALLIIFLLLPLFCLLRRRVGKRVSLAQFSYSLKR
jgi:membrane protein DedA with SNARE-associated domain